jgi:hypothetical protein
MRYASSGENPSITQTTPPEIEQANIFSPFGEILTQETMGNPETTGGWCR